MNPLSPSILARPVHSRPHGLKTAAKCAALLLATLSAATGLQAQSNYATPYTFSNFAGVSDNGGSIDATGAAARFHTPSSVAVDASGNVYVADTYNHTIRKITPGRLVTTLAGKAGIPGTNDGTGPDARFYYPYSLAVDAAGSTIYVADSGNNTIRKLTLNGAAWDVTTLAGTAGTNGSADGTGPAAQFSSPQGVAVDGTGNIYVADTNNSTIRMVTPGGVVTTVAGTPNTFGSDDGTGPAAQFLYPVGVAVDATGSSVYVADYGNNTIRKMTLNGLVWDVTTLAGTAGSTGSLDGTGSAARFTSPAGVALDGTGTIYVADTANNTMRKITPVGVVTTLAGSPGIYGSADGTGSAAQFSLPFGVAVNATGTTLYAADSNNNTIRMITSGGVVTTLAGTSPYGSEDSEAKGARFNLPYGVAVDGSGNVYVADTINSTIRKITFDGFNWNVTTLAGTAGSPGSANGTGSAARFSYPQGVAVDGSGNVYVADSSNATIRKITSGGVVTTLAGTAGSFGSADGTGSAARFNAPGGVAVNGTGTVYVADTQNHTIRKITPGGVVTTLAGTAGSSGSANGTGSAARFNLPGSVAVDGSGNVYVADTNNSTIRKITPAGVVTTLAGIAGNGGAADGAGGAAQFSYPTGVAVDGAGNLFVSESSSTIRRISFNGVNWIVTTLAGTTYIRSSANATGSAARFNLPFGLAVDGAGQVYVADTFNGAIRVGVPLIPGDFSSDLKPDIVWQNTTSGELGFWLMNGTTFSSWVDLGPLPTDLRIAATGDFNGDGQTDIVWENTASGKRVIWLMNGTGFVSSVNLGLVPTEWRIAAAADFNGDGSPDILWENTSTGDRGIWLMNGTTYSDYVDLATVPLEWRIAGAGDFDADGHPDIVWENTVTGDRYVWLMDGTGSTASASLGNVPIEWRIAQVADFNGDGQPDILWENTSTGERGFYIMNGTTCTQWISIGFVVTEWRIAN